MSEPTDKPISILLTEPQVQALIGILETCETDFMPRTRCLIREIVDELEAQTNKGEKL